jgi:hypothetical protein
MSIMFRLFRWLVFKVGDIRKINHFPKITWDVHEHKISLDEVIRDALPKLQPGDVILHRDDGYLSNLFIGGAMIHAGIYVGDGYVVEALSDDQGGVVKRHAANILRSDRACILRPDDLAPLEIHEAVFWASRIIGFKYDVLFDFNTEDEQTAVMMGKADAVRFCCTEIPLFCYMRFQDRLRIYRRRNVNFITKILHLFGLHPGDQVIDADMYLDANFSLIWASKEYTSDWCKHMGVNEGHRRKIEEYWKERK